METKLTDFSLDELQAAYVAISVYQAKSKDEKMNEKLQLWRVQILNAVEGVKDKETISSN